MNAGPEMDALVAEHVMGIKPRQVRLRGSTESVTIYSDNPYYADGACDMSGLYWAMARPYSTESAAAWEVVERMKPQRPNLSYTPSKGHYVGQWMVIFDGTDACQWAEGEAHEESFPLAVCLAALTALGVEVPA